MSEARMEDLEPEPSEGSTSEASTSDQSQLIEFVRERPWACLLGAAALGFLAARLVRGAR